MKTRQNPNHRWPVGRQGQMEVAGGRWMVGGGPPSARIGDVGKRKRERYIGDPAGKCRECTH